ncbi:hypothetical protein SZMC14600_09958 [Saccharomonospora azurea SZMC 14600]|uniref:NAD(P)-dependent oxidoreductase n=1 Tax=Saccharomonospora azurea TaxID=40988 RepID=UPI00024005CC|nr:NAD(P)H-binding protein [Saccharomonospora azurea]EHK87637.1 hypothetical protein SZMC14600_09958 [Saccharomonospora azurea SZMC 14600]
MKLLVIGATGMAGSRVVGEALARGHEVTAVSRNGGSMPPSVTAVRADVTDVGRMTSLFAAADTVVCAIRPRRGEEPSATTTALLDVAATTRTRVVVVAGAGPLRSPGRGDLLVVDDPRYVAPEWRAAAVTSVEQFRLCQAHPADCVYVSPAALLEPGVRTGHYRRGTDTLVVAPDGTSRISAEDLAAAVLDEIEQAGGRRHIAVGY